MAKPLKLLAFDEADLVVVSAMMQDAVLRVADLEYHPSTRRLLLPVNRFAWEVAPSRSLLRQKRERHRAVLDIAEVERVRSRGFDREDGKAVLSLLSISFERKAADEPEGCVVMVFAGGAELRVDVGALELRLTDFDARWSALATPRHGDAAQ